MTAAAGGGPRYDASLTPEERRSAENGIYLCAVCANMIDKNNGIDYPIELLRRWKEEHERWTIERQSVIQNGQLRVADMFVDNEGYRFPRVDVRVLNLGSDTVVLTRGTIKTCRHVPIPSNRRFSRLDSSWSYDVEFGERAGDIREFELSQVIASHGADRFELVLKGNWPDDDPALNLYELEVSLNQGRDTTIGITLPRILIHMPFAGRPLAETTFPPDTDDRARIRNEAKEVAQRLLSELSVPQNSIYCDALVIDALRSWAGHEPDSDPGSQSRITIYE